MRHPGGRNCSRGLGALEQASLQLGACHGRLAAARAAAGEVERLTAAQIGDARQHEEKLRAEINDARGELHTARRELEVHASSSQHAAALCASKQAASERDITEAKWQLAAAMAEASSTAGSGGVDVAAGAAGEGEAAAAAGDVEEVRRALKQAEEELKTLQVEKHSAVSNQAELQRELAATKRELQANSSLAVCSARESSNDHDAGGWQSAWRGFGERAPFWLLAGGLLVACEAVASALERWEIPTHGAAAWELADSSVVAARTHLADVLQLESVRDSSLLPALEIVRLDVETKLGVLLMPLFDYVAAAAPQHARQLPTKPIDQLVAALITLTSTCYALMVAWAAIRIGWRFVLAGAWLACTPIFLVVRVLRCRCWLRREVAVVPSSWQANIAPSCKIKGVSKSKASMDV